MATLTARFFRTPASPGICVVRRDSDGFRWDFTNSVFSDTPALDYQAPVEDAVFNGMYLLEIPTIDWTGLYQVFHYASSAKVGKPLTLAINLTNGAQDNAYIELSERVRLEMDANSVALTQLVAGVNVAKVNGVIVAGTGTELDPWRPTA